MNHSQVSPEQILQILENNAGCMIPSEHCNSPVGDGKWAEMLLNTLYILQAGVMNSTLMEREVF